MATFKCLSCGAIYDDRDATGAVYFHACPTERIKTRASFDQATGKQTAEEVREPLPNPRNENMRGDLVYLEGKPVIRSRDPNDATRITYTPALSFILAEGAGRAPYDRATNITGNPLLGPTIPGK